jgi:hypothetical protein
MGPDFYELLNGNVFKHLKVIIIVQNQGSSKTEELMPTTNRVD